MVKPDRIACLVLGCRRTAPADKYPAGTRIICGKCWRLAPRQLRRAIRRLERRLEELLGKKWANISGDEAAPGSKEDRLFAIHSRIFDRIAGRAAEVRVGIG